MNSDFENDMGVISWDGEIDMEKSSPRFVLLDEGDYNFEIVDCTRSQYPGSAKLPKCPKAELKLCVNSENGSAFVRFDLIFATKLEWKLAEFLESIGVPAVGKIKIDWSTLIGKKGRAHIRQKSYVGRDGEEKKANEVAFFIKYDKKYFTKKEPPKQEKYFDFDEIEDDFDERP